MLSRRLLRPASRQGLHLLGAARLLTKNVLASRGENGCGRQTRSTIKTRELVTERRCRASDFPDRVRERCREADERGSPEQRPKRSLRGGLTGTTRTLRPRVGPVQRRPRAAPAAATWGTPRASPCPSLRDRTIAPRTSARACQRAQASAAARLRPECRSPDAATDRRLLPRLSRRLAEALAGARKATDDTNGGDANAFSASVVQGVSANLCDALATLTEALPMLGVSVVWARTQSRDELRTVVRFPAHDGPILREASRALRGRVIDAPPPLGAAGGFAAHLDTGSPPCPRFSGTRPWTDQLARRTGHPPEQPRCRHPQCRPLNGGPEPGPWPLLAW